MKIKSLMILGLILMGSGSVWAGQIFSDLFNNSTYIDTAATRTTALRTGGQLVMGYPNIYLPNQSWQYRWGDFATLGNFIYTVWADNRYNGKYTVFMSKINKSDGLNAWPSNMIVGEVTNQTYLPSIAIKDNTHIYVSFLRENGEIKRVWAARFTDAGTYLTRDWYKQIDYDWGGSSDNHPVPYLIETAVDQGNYKGLYVYANYNSVGGGTYDFAMKVRESDGWSYSRDAANWRSGTYPGYDAIASDFSSGNDMIINNGYLYFSGEHWMWSPSRESGAYLQKMSTNISTSKSWGSFLDRDGRGELSSYYTGNALMNSLVINTNENHLYHVWSDHRNGNLDIFITKLDLSGTFLWGAPNVRPVVTGAGIQCDAVADFQYLGSGTEVVWIAWIDYNNNSAIKLTKFLEDGSLGATYDVSTVMKTPALASQDAYHPEIKIIGDKLYLAFMTSYDNHQIRIACFDISAGTIGAPLWRNNDLQTVTYKVDSQMYSTKLIFPGLVGTVKKAKINAVYSRGGGTVNFALAPDGLNFTNTLTNKEVTFLNAGADFRVKISYDGNGISNMTMNDYSVDATEYYTGNIAYGSNLTTLFGKTTLNSSPLSQVIMSKVWADGIQSNVIFVVVTNMGNTAGTFYFTGVGGNTRWDVQYFDGAADVTSQVFSADGYAITALGANTSRTIRVITKPTAEAEDGELFDNYIYVTAVPQAAAHDAIDLQTVALKFRPDIAVDRSGSLIGLKVYQTTPTTQSNSAILNSRFTKYTELITNDFIISNSGITNEVIFVSNWFVNNPANWTIKYTNKTTQSSIASAPFYISLSKGQFNRIGVIVTPKTNTAVNETLTVGFYVRATNGTAYTNTVRHDACKLIYKSIKVQPDMIISLRDDFFLGMSNNNYTYTNVNLKQIITQRTVSARKVTYYVKMENDGLMKENIKLYANRVMNPGWTISYKVSGVSIEAQLTNTGYWANLNPGENRVIVCEYMPDDTVPTADTLLVDMRASSSNKPFIYDEIKIRPKCFKVFPDIMISSTYSGTYISNNNSAFLAGYASTNTNLKGQILFQRVEQNQPITNYFIVQNDSTDPDDILVKATMSDANWTFVYFDSNAGSWNNVTGQITNQYLINLSAGSQRMFRVVQTPSTSTPADSIKTLLLKVWSNWVPNQRDHAAFSNINVQIRPHITLTGNDDGNDFTASYSAAMSSVYQTAGKKYNYALSLKNNGGSAESYRLMVSTNLSGGQAGDWKIRILHNLGASTNDVTASVMGSGLVVSYSSNQSREYLIEAIATNLAWTNPASSRGAVSNHLAFNIDFKSETKSTKMDKARLDIMIQRGVPDVIIGNTFTKNQIYGSYAAANLTTLGIVLKYPKTFETYVNNSDNPSFYALAAEDYYIRANVSNVKGIYGNWRWKFLDQNDNDITASITNATGFLVTNIEVGQKVPVRIWAVNTNGIVWDKIAVRYEVRSKYQTVRKDFAWHYLEVVPGFPELTVFNDSVYRGIGQYSLDSSFDAQIESNQTTHYRLILSNTAPVHGFPAFIIKEIPQVTNGFSVVYKVNGTNVSRSTMLNSIFTNNIYNSLTNKTPKWAYVDIYITPTTAVSGQYCQMNYKFYLADNENVYDDFTIRNVMVKPKVDIYYLDFTNTVVKAYLKPGEYVSYELREANQDVVAGDVKTTGSSGNASIVYTYTRLSGSDSSDITSLVTGAGWTTNIGGSRNIRMGVRATADGLALSGSRYNATITLSSVKNPTKNDLINLAVETVNAKVDMAVWTNGVLIGNGVYFGGAETSVTNRMTLAQVRYFTNRIDNDLATGSNVQYILEEASSYQMSDYLVQYYIGATPITLPYSNISLLAGRSTNVIVKLTSTVSNSSGKIGYIQYKARARRVSGLEDRITMATYYVSPGVKATFGFVSVLTNIVQPKFSKYIQYEVENTDTVNDTFVMKGTGGNAHITVNYYELPSTNEITASMSSGYRIALTGKQKKLFLIKVSALDGSVSGENITATVTAYSASYTNKRSTIAAYTEVRDGLPDVSLRLAKSASSVGQNVYYYQNPNQGLVDYIYLPTNKYILRVENDISVGSSIQFNVKEINRDSMGAYKVNYKRIVGAATNAISLTNYPIFLGFGQGADILVETIQTNTSLPSGDLGILGFQLQSADIESAVDRISLFLSNIRPNVAIRYPDNMTTTRTIYLTNIKSMSFPIQFVNLDTGIHERIKIIATNFLEKRFNYKFEYVYSSNRTDITTEVLTNGWISPPQDPLAAPNMIWVTAEPIYGAVDSDYVECTLKAVPIHNTNAAKHLRFEVRLVNSIINTYVAGGNLPGTNGIEDYYPVEQSCMDRVESGETNVYSFALANDTAVGGKAVSIGVYPSFTQDTAMFNTVFMTNGVAVNPSNYVAFLAYGERVFLTAKIWPKPTTVSGKKMTIGFCIRVTNAQVFQDTVKLTVFKSAPKPIVKVAGPMDRVWKIDSYKDTGRVFQNYKKLRTVSLLCRYQRRRGLGRFQDVDKDQHHKR